LIQTPLTLLTPLTPHRFTWRKTPTKAIMPKPYFKKRLARLTLHNKDMNLTDKMPTVKIKMESSIRIA